ncbi:hypothetical protein [Fuerstiella marisgermanici]|nr:hypothetical protein [Fuerstiella marisgermanici]
MSASAMDVDAEPVDLMASENLTGEMTEHAVFGGLFGEELSAADGNGTNMQFIDIAELAASAQNTDLVASSEVTGEGDSDDAPPPAAYAEYIVLDGEDNDAVLEDNGNALDDLVQLRSTNGTFETIVFRLPTDQLVIDLGAGDDNLTVNGLELVALTAELFINGQGGDDSITLNSLETLNNVYVYDMEGNNDFRSNNFDIGGNLYISDGGGDQTVVLSSTTVDGDVNIISTSGGSSITLGFNGGPSAQIHGSVTIDNMGTGSDFVRLGGLIFGDFYVNAGDGDFELRSIFSSVRGGLFTNVNKGDSTIFLGDFAASEHSYFISGEGDTDTWLTAAFFPDGLTIQNGLGFDELRLDGAGSYNSDPEGQPGVVTVHNGDGGSLTSFNLTERLFPLRFNEFRIYNGQGDDTFDLNYRERDLLGTFFADNGEGNTTVEVTGDGTIQDATFISGEGTDSFSFDGVDVLNDLIINSGTGNRTLDIQNSEIGNLQLSGSTGNPILYGDGDDEIFAPIGNNIIDGGGGDDVLVIYEGDSTDYTVTYESDGTVIVEGPGLNGTTVRNELTNVERILFNDGLIFLSDSDDPNDPDVPTTVGTDGDDWLALPDPGGRVEAGAGDDFIYAPVGSLNEIDGGSGIDTLVIYEGGRADFTIRRDPDSLLVEIEGPGLNGSTVVNRLTDVEFILFTDGLVSVDEL